MLDCKGKMAGVLARSVEKDRLPQDAFARMRAAALVVLAAPADKMALAQAALAAYTPAAIHYSPPAAGRLVVGCKVRIEALLGWPAIRPVFCFRPEGENL